MSIKNSTRRLRFVELSARWGHGMPEWPSAPGVNVLTLQYHANHGVYQAVDLPREPYVDYAESQLPEDNGPDELRIGARVMHPTFGAGIVRRREGRGEAAKAWVDFERGGIKLLVLKFAHLRAIAR